MRHHRISLLSIIFMCLTALVLTSGCGGGGCQGSCYGPDKGGGSSWSGTSKFGKIIFLFPDMKTAAKMLKSAPEGTRYISFYGSNSQGDALYGPVEYEAANKVILNDVPITTTVFFLQFRDADHEILKLYATDWLTLKSEETITITVDDFEAEWNAPKLMAVTADPDTIAAGFTTQCEASITYGNSAVQKATEFVDWTSSAVSVATVNNSDSKGKVSGLAPGSADITADIADLKESVSITVTDAALESLKITTPYPFVLISDIYQFRAQGTFSDGTSKDVTNEVSWTSSDTSIAEIDEAGLALAVAGGQAKITATSANGLSDTTSFNVADTSDVRSITIERTDSDTETVPLGFTASYKAVAKIGPALKDYDVTDQVTWNTENGATGSFSYDTPGLYETQGCETGDTVISCIYEENDVASNTLNLAVTDAKITDLAVFGIINGSEAEAPYILSNRENVQFIAKASLSDGSEMILEPGSNLTWTIEPNDASIDGNGLVTPAQAGAQFTPQLYSVKASYNYTYQPSGESATFDADTDLSAVDAFQVNAITLEAIEPSPTDEGISLPVGHTAKFKAAASVSTMDLTFDVTDQVTWSDVAAVGSIDKGIFTAEQTGFADVTASLNLPDISGSTPGEVISNTIRATVTDAILESVAIDQNAPQIINNNNDFVFTASATYSDGSTVTLDPANLPDGAAITWTSADTSIAEIDGTTGAVTPKADSFGQTEITVSYTERGETADASTMLSTYDAMSVTELAIDTIPAGVTECANGYTVQLQATAKIGTRNMEIDVTRQVEWNNADIAAIGAIDENGVFTAAAAGSADIKATLTLADYGDEDQTVESDPISFTVTDAVLKSIILTSTDGVTDFGETAPQILNNNNNLVFTATGVFSDGSEQALSSADGLAWSSDDTGIAAIDADGAVTPETTAWGQTEIAAAATNSEGEEISASIMLSTADAMSVTALELTVDNDQTTCAQGYTAQFRVTATVGTEGMTYDVTGQAQFENIDGIGTIDGHGLFTGTTVGTASVKATFTARDYSGAEVNTESNAIDFEVTDAVLESITITSEAYGEADPQILNTDNTLAFTATGHFSYGDDQVLTDVTWASSETGVATIGADGAVSPNAGIFGQTEITATSGEVSGSIMLSTYDALSVTGLELTADNGVTTCAQGYTVQLRAVATIGTTGMTFDVTDQVTFSGYEDIGTIDARGLFTGTDTGTAAITATYSFAGLSGEPVEYGSNELELEVTSAVLESITITSEDFDDKAPQILNTDTTLVFTATGHFSYGDDQVLTGVTWSSSEETVATIGADGAVTPDAGAFGQTEITATSGDVSASIMLSTYDAMSVTDLALSADGDTASVAKGYNVQLRAIATIGTTGMTFDVTDQVTFEGYMDIGIIDDHGLFTATDTGNASITAIYSFAGLSGDVTDYESNDLELEVTDAVLESIIITSSDGVTDFGEDDPQILNNNMNLVFTATGIFSDGTELENLTVAWSSGNTDIAEIDAETGAASPKADAWGQTKITATSGDISADIMLSTADAMAVTNITVTVDGDLTSIAKGMTAQFRAVATIGADATAYDITDKVTWEALTDLGTIDEHGLFTAETPGGPVDVIATYNDVSSDPYAFEVTGAAIDHIEIAPANPTILNTQTQVFTAKAIMTDGTEIDPLPASGLAWSSSDETICEINNEGMAVPVPYQWGQVIVTASYSDPDTGDTFDGKTTLSVITQGYFAQVCMIANYVPGTFADEDFDFKVFADVTYTIPTASGDISVTDIPVVPDPNNHANMRFVFSTLEDGGVIKSVTLYTKIAGGEDAGTRYAFAWYNSEDGIAVEPGRETVIDEAANTFAGGTGSESDPYLVANPRQLNNVNDYMASSFLQICDIDFEGSTGLKVDRYEESYVPGKPLPVIVTATEDAPFFNNDAGWRPIGMDSKQDFKGTYNGGGFEIRDLILNITTTESAVVKNNRINCGLFAMTRQAVIENLKLADSCCFYVDVPVSVRSVRDELGAFAGSIASSTLTDLENNATVAVIGNDPHASGIVAHCDAINRENPDTISRCRNSGMVFSFSERDSSNSAGIISYAQGRSIVSECWNSGDIFAYTNGNNTKIGGIVGAITESDIYDCWNTGNLSLNLTSAESSAGGIAGCSTLSHNASISRCWSTGAITAEGTASIRIGAVSGYDNRGDVAISDCFYWDGCGLSHGVGNVSTDVEAHTKACTLDELKNLSEISRTGTTAGYLNDLLNGAGSVWSVNTKEDDEIAPGVLKGFSVFSWEL